MEKYFFKKNLASNCFEIQLLKFFLNDHKKFVFDKPKYWLRTRTLDNYQIVQTPLFIIGANPFLNLLLFSKVSSNNISSIIHMPNYEDLWPYYLLDNEVVKKTFNIGFDIKDNNNFFKNLLDKIKLNSRDNNINFALSSNKDISITRSNDCFLDKHVFWLKDVKDIVNFNEFKKPKQSDIYNKIYNDFKDRFSNYELEGLYGEERKHVCIIADYVLTTSFLPYMQYENLNTVFQIGTSSNYFNVDNFEDLKILNIKNIAELIYGDKLNAWLSQIKS